MRILIVTQYFWPENFRINDLAMGLAERKHDVEVLTGMPNYPAGQLFKGYTLFGPFQDSYHGIPIRRVPLIPRYKGRALNLILNYFSFAISASFLLPFRYRGNYDIIFVFEPSPVTVGIPAIILKHLNGAALLFWVQDLWPDSLSATGAVHSRRILAWVRTFVSKLYRQCDRILIQSRAFKSSVLSQGAPAGKVIYYPNSAERLYFPVELSPDAAERELVPEGFVVMFAGNIGTAQDFKTILEAAEKLRSNSDIHFVILAAGRRYNWLKLQVESRGLWKNFHLLGRHPLESMPRFFSLADALLVTLRKDPIFELTIPSKLQSYMACGRPIIVGLDGEGARIVKSSGCGLATPAENSAKLALSINTLYEMPADQRIELGENGRRYFLENFERELLIDRLETIFSETIKEVSG